ncbi:curli assembly protein CsgF [Halomonas sp. M20]|uniref:curli assembly protein CsgF n=1 Tax=Halomonas sp. M20 TaxID=2763264 RepID=UPI001D0B5FF4|nr:curli assembly protein CsgF [Halomonas sp. M20]
MATVVLAAAGMVQAGDLIYRPINPSFGGDPFNSSHLLQTAEIQNEYKDDGSEFDSLFEEPSAAEEFADAINRTLIGESANELANAVFEQGTPSGSFTFDDAMVSYQTVGDRMKITVSDGLQTNVVTVPKPDNK